MATPFALLLMYPGDVDVAHAKREVTIARWIRLVKTPARTAVLLRELRRELNATLAELFERPPASSGLSDHTTSAIDVVARLLQEEPTRAIDSSGDISGDANLIVPLSPAEMCAP